MSRVIFCTAFLVAHEQQLYAILVPVEIIDNTPKIACTEQQELGKSFFTRIALPVINNIKRQ
jgi:hypothetical protein